jgi:hypothetical protein
VGVRQAKGLLGIGSAVNAAVSAAAKPVRVAEGPRAEGWRRALRFASPRIHRDVRCTQLRAVCGEQKELVLIPAPTIAHRASHCRVIHLQRRRHGGHPRAANVIQPVVEVRHWPASPSVTGGRIVNGRPPVRLPGNGVQRFSRRLGGSPSGLVSSARRPTSSGRS